MAPGTLVQFKIESTTSGYVAYTSGDGWNAPNSASAIVHSCLVNTLTTSNTKRIDGLFIDWQPNELVDNDGDSRNFYTSWDADYFYIRMEEGFGDGDRINIAFDEDPGTNYGSPVGAFSGANFTGMLTPEYVVQSTGTVSLNVFNRSGTSWSFGSDIYDSGNNLFRTGSNAEIRIPRSALGGLAVTADFGMFVWLSNGSDEMYSGFGLDNYPNSYSPTARRMRTAYVWDNSNSGTVISNDYFLDHSASEVTRTLGFTTGIRNLYLSANTALTQSGTVTSITGEVFIRNIAGLELQNDLNVGGNFYKHETGIFTHNNNTVNLNGDGDQDIEVDFGTDTLTITFYDLVLSGAGDKTLEDTVFITNDLTISGTARMVGTNQVVIIGGDMDATSSDPYTGGVSSLSEVIFNGTGSRTISNTDGITFRNLIINSSGDYTVNGDITISVDTFTIVDATVNMGTNTLDGSGVLKMTSGLLQLGKLSTTLPEISDLALSGTSIIELNGAGSQTLRGSRPYVNITLSNSGTKTFSSSITGENNITGTITMNDNVVVEAESKTIGGTGTNFTMTGTSRYITSGGSTKPDASGTYSLGSGTTIEFAKNGSGNQVIRLAPEYANIVISGESPANTNTSGTGGIDFMSGGSFTVTSTGTFRFESPNGFTGSAGTAISNVNSPTITLDPGSTIEYMGAAQTITNEYDYYNLSINDAGTKTPAGDIIVQGDLILTEGIIELGASNLIMTNASGSALGDDDSYVITDDAGVFRRIITEGSSGIYSFPLGSSADYQPATIEWTAAAGINELSARFIDSPLGAPTGLTSSAYGVDPTPITAFLDNGYWEINSTGSGTPADYAVTLDARSVGNLGALAEQHAIFKNSSTDPATWAQAGTPVDVWAGSSTPTAGFGGQIVPVSESVSGFSIFAIGRSATNVLPITLVSFEAELVQLDVELTWVTASEINNDYFVVEHSLDGISWNAVGQVSGAGTTTTEQYYAFTHTQAVAGNNYYRLKQVDFNGDSEYSEIRNVFIGDGGEIAVYPNPTSGILNVPAGIEMQVLDASGRMVSQTLTNGNPVNLNELPEGIYTLRLIQGEAISYVRLVKL